MYRILKLFATAVVMLILAVAAYGKIPNFHVSADQARAARAESARLTARLRTLAGEEMRLRDNYDSKVQPMAKFRKDTTLVIQRMLKAKAPQINKYLALPLSEINRDSLRMLTTLLAYNAGNDRVLISQLSSARQLSDYLNREQGWKQIPQYPYSQYDLLDACDSIAAFETRCPVQKEEIESFKRSIDDYSYCWRDMLDMVTAYSNVVKANQTLLPPEGTSPHSVLISEAREKAISPLVDDTVRVAYIHRIPFMSNMYDKFVKEAQKNPFAFSTTEEEIYEMLKSRSPVSLIEVPSAAADTTSATALMRYSRDNAVLSARIADIESRVNWLNAMLTRRGELMESQIPAWVNAKRKLLQSPVSTLKIADLKAIAADIGTFNSRNQLLKELQAEIDTRLSLMNYIESLKIPLTRPYDYTEVSKAITGARALLPSFRPEDVQMMRTQVITPLENYSEGIELFKKIIMEYQDNNLVTQYRQNPGLSAAQQQKAKTACATEAAKIYKKYDADIRRIFLANPYLNTKWEEYKALNKRSALRSDPDPLETEILGISTAPY